MYLILSIVHLLFMIVTVIPFGTVLLLLFVMGQDAWVYKTGACWLTLSTRAARWLLGIRYRVQGLDNLPQGATSQAVLLVKHQSAWETIVLQRVCPWTLFVWKKELKMLPFFGWALAASDQVAATAKATTRV
mgnify:CR=1 FL=1